MKPSLYSKPERAARHAAGYAYTLIRSGRRTLAIEIKEDAGVLVRAPQRLPLWQIEAFLEQKQAWIAEKLAQARRSAQARDAARAVRPRRLPLFGVEYPVCCGQAEPPAFAEGRFSLPDVPPAELPPLIEAIYREQAACMLPQRVSQFAAVMGVAPSAVKISGAAGRWGSCSGKNSLNFSWRLALAPLEAVDYVVVHELAHIREHNHSQRFWRLVERYQPDYRRAQELLKTLARRLHDEWAL